MQLTWQQAIGVDPTHLTEFADNQGKIHLVHQAICQPLSLLVAKAQKDGIELAIISSYRSFESQLAIWNEKWLGHRPVYSRHGRPLNIVQLSDMERYKAISLWSAMPGYSRHHWGTDLDIFDGQAIKKGHRVELTPDEFSAEGPCADLADWLDENLKDAGFFRPYREYRHGVSQEPWHISHRATATEILENFDFKSCQDYVAASAILAKDFICNHLEHYQQNYFCNICEES